MVRQFFVEAAALEHLELGVDRTPGEGTGDVGNDQVGAGEGDRDACSTKSGTE